MKWNEMQGNDTTTATHRDTHSDSHTFTSPQSPKDSCVVHFCHTCGITSTFRSVHVLSCQSLRAEREREREREREER